MSHNTVSTSGNAEFELRIRQALLSAKHTVPQVAVLLFAFNHSNTSDNLGAAGNALNNSALMRLRGGLRDSDTVAAATSASSCNRCRVPKISIWS